MEYITEKQVYQLMGIACSVTFLFAVGAIVCIANVKGWW